MSGKIKELFEKYKIDKDYSGWIESYKERCKEFSEIKGLDGSSDEYLRNLWFEKSNGVSSVGSGSLSHKEYDSWSVNDLPRITKDIQADSSPSSFSRLLDWLRKAKLEGKFHYERRAVLARVFATANPKLYTTVLNDAHLQRLLRVLNESPYELKISLDGTWADRNQSLTKAIDECVDFGGDYFIRNTFIWYLKEVLLSSNKKPESEGDEITDTGRKPNSISEYLPLNRILYGPPGTGKTYHSIEASVRAADPVFDWGDSRAKLKTRYDELVSEGRIRFVTFHQSYGYEEFVEGLRAETNEAGQISYTVEAGVFQRIANDAARNASDRGAAFDGALREFINELGESGRISLQTQKGKAFQVDYSGGKTFRIFPEDTIKEDMRSGYPASLQHVSDLYYGIEQDKVYNPSYVKGILKYLIDKYELPEFDSVSEKESDSRNNYVLIIDEINRGNISKIFGELITLIEPSKRAGADEAIIVDLPYSRRKFGVPDNLYIIGTMNTADRSLSMIDTALRRRFDFIEMMPDLNPLKHKAVDITPENKDDDAEIDLSDLLMVMNRRIESLYDREHCLGHAFFMPVVAAIDSGDSAGAWLELRSVFKNKIIPLLEEYFFEDWNKISLVLGDQEKLEANRFIRKRNTESELEDLFGSDYTAESYDSSDNSFYCNYPALDEPGFYAGIVKLGGDKRTTKAASSDRDHSSKQKEAN